MENIHTSKHAAVRMHQRNIPPLVIDLLMEFGESEKSGDGTTKFFFTKAARKRLTSYAGPLASILKPHLDVYVVVADDQKLVTAAHRLARIRRH
tara:strand:+ start:11456 stop:11737 length:282 start_codon:yes stop_codon:yes gene_type:complete